MKAQTILVALVAATLSYVPVAAQTAGSGVHEEIVRYGDLDLSQPEDVRRLDRRLRNAIAKLCGPTSPADPVGMRAVRECRGTLLAETACRREALVAGTATDGPIVVALARSSGR
jgi:UrcA family protein